MPHLGDIVQTTAQWRDRRIEIGGNLEELNAEWPASVLAIVVAETHASGVSGPVLYHRIPGQQMQTSEWGNHTIGDHHYLEVVYAVNTPEAQAIHERYPQYEGRDYNWYLEQRGLLPPVIQEPATHMDWLPGDIIERINTYWTFNGQRHTPGTRFFVRANDDRRVLRENNVPCNTLDGQYAGGQIPGNLRWISRPSQQATLEEQAANTDWEEYVAPEERGDPVYWQVGARVQVNIPDTTSFAHRFHLRQGTLVRLAGEESGHCVYLDGEVMRPRYFQSECLVYLGIPTEEVGDAIATLAVGQRVRLDVPNRANNHFSYTFNGREGNITELLPGYNGGEMGYRISLDGDTMIRNWGSSYVVPLFEPAVQPEPRPFQVGDRVRIVGINTHVEGVNGEEGIIESITAADNWWACVLSDNPRLTGQWTAPHVELVTPAPTQAPQDLPADQWQVGDIVECISSQNSEGNAGIISVGMRVTITSQRENGGIRSCLMPNGRDSGRVLHDFAFRFIERPSQPVAAAPVAFMSSRNHTEWQTGDIIRRNNGVGPTWMEGNELIITSKNDSEIRVSALDGSQYIGTHEILGAWECEYFTWVRRPNTTTMPIAQLQQGSRVRVVNTAEPWLGTTGTIIEYREGTNHRVQMDAGELQYWPSNKLELLDQQVTTPLPPVQWQPGDIVRRVRGRDWTSEIAIGTEAEVAEAPNMRIPAGYQQQNLRLFRTNERTAHHHTSDYEFIRRPVLRIPTGLPECTQLGSRVLVTKAGVYQGKAASITNHRGSGRYYVLVDGTDAVQVFLPDELAVLTQEPEMPVLVTTASRSIWLSLDGVSDEEINTFVDALKNLGINTSYYDKDQGNGSRSLGCKNRLDGRKPGLFLDNGTLCYLYYRHQGQHAGSLLRDWNQVLLNVAKVNGTKLATSQENAVVKKHGLSKLPPFFIIEGSDKATTGNQEYLTEHGFRGFTGKYSLFAHNQVIGTSSRAVAEAFQQKKSAIWLDGKQDVLLLKNLFTTRKNMLTTQAAKQRFAIDVAGSGPHLIRAFISYMASIGYRQENPEKLEGPYILLNGGNIHANQPATWQYSEVKNNRNATLSLSEAATENSNQSGWEKMCERLSNRGVALPVLDAEDLDRTPVKDDLVVLVDNAVSPGLPETEEVLRAHTCGKQYKVLGVASNGMLRLDTSLLLHPSRVQVLETPLGIQNGDLVFMVQNYGEHLTQNQVLTYMNKQLVSEKQEAYSVPKQFYTALADERLVERLLKSYQMTLPCVARITTEGMLGSGDEVVISTAWPLNNQELAFWTEETAEKESWYERKDFQVVTYVGNQEAPKATIIKGHSKETTLLKVGDVELSLAELEAVFSS